MEKTELILSDNDLHTLRREGTIILALKKKCPLGAELRFQEGMTATILDVQDSKRIGKKGIIEKVFEHCISIPPSRRESVMGR